MESQPWHFDHHVMILDDAKGNMKPSEIPLHLVPFWIRVYDLPFRGRSNEDNARRLGDKIGSYITMDKSDVIGINKSLRIRVLVDVNKPLKKVMELRTGRGTMEVPIKYEKLSVFCYVCGLLGHREKDCDENGVRRMYDESLRVATPWKATKNESYDEAGDLSKAVRKLFITKHPKHSTEEGEEDSGMVKNVTQAPRKMATPSREEQMVAIPHDVSLVLSDEVAKGSNGVVNEEKVEKEKTNVGDEVVACVNVDNESSLVSRNEKTDKRGEMRQWKRLSREG
uniref:CCHC-type domain-containing protein n=1 Tax=Chenopodium quinoa TaxID=63459 RepID=A0A803M515_CHEQI